MVQLDDIVLPIKNDFEAFRELLRQTTLAEESAFMRPITQHILTSGGKQMRPLLTLLTAKLCGEINERVLASAVLIEMIHWSTLVHDDVIDEGYVRRGKWTPAALLRSKTAVLVGDYLFSKGLTGASERGCYKAIKSATRAIERIVDGELLQMEHARRMDTTEAIYTEIIRLKTGALLASAAECGAFSSVVEDQEDQITVAQNMFRFGEVLGLAFQVKDDLIDYGFTTQGKDTGKILCNDLTEGKMTLPLIYAFSQRPNEQRLMRRHLKKASNGGNGSRKSVEWLRKFVEENGGVSYAVQVMEQYHREAVDILASYPESPAKTALRQYADYVIGRNH